MMTEPQFTRETGLSQVNEEEYLQILEGARQLAAENLKLKERIDLLEHQIVTHAFGGWQTH
jgi:hypothetical protein